MRTHRDLIVWKRSIDFVTAIYRETKNFPNSELYGLTSQIRRATVSIPSNIAEGAARNHNKEFIQFLYIALSSASEVETQLIISSNLEFIDKKVEEYLLTELNEISKMLKGLINSVTSKSNSK